MPHRCRHIRGDGEASVPTDKAKKDPAKPTRAIAARPDLPPIEPALAELLNPGIGRGTAGVGSQTELDPARKDTPSPVLPLKWGGTRRTLLSRPACSRRSIIRATVGAIFPPRTRHANRRQASTKPRNPPIAQLPSAIRLRRCAPSGSLRAAVRECRSGRARSTPTSPAPWGSRKTTTGNPIPPPARRLRATPSPALPLKGGGRA